MRWVLNDFTSTFFESEVENICLSGEFRSGKTTIACLKVDKLLRKYPGNIGVIIRNISSELKAVTMPEYLEVCFENRHDVPRGYYYNQTDKHIIYPKSNSELWFIALDNPRQMKKLKGMKIGVLWIDQPEEIDKNIFNMACGRVCHNVPLLQKIFTPNPEGGDHYLKSLFYVEEIKTRKEEMKLGGEKYPIHYGYWQGIDETYLGITAKPLANKKNLPKNYYENLIKTFPYEWTMKYIFANWYGKSGLIYPLKPGNTITEMPFDYDKLEFPAERFELNDYGISETNPMVWLNLVYKNGIYYVTHEFYQFNSSIGNCATYANELKDIFSIDSMYRIGCPRAFQREGTSNNLTPAMLFAKQGIKLAKFPIHIETRRPILQSLFKLEQIKISQKCRELLKELHGLKWQNEKSAPAHAIEALERGIAKHYLSKQRRGFEKVSDKKQGVREVLAGAAYMNEAF